MKKGFKVNIWCGYIVMFAFAMKWYAQYNCLTAWYNWAEKTILLCALIGAIAVTCELISWETDNLSRVIMNCVRKFKRTSNAK